MSPREPLLCYAFQKPASRWRCSSSLMSSSSPARLRSCIVEEFPTISARNRTDVLCQRRGSYQKSLNERKWQSWRSNMAAFETRSFFVLAFFVFWPVRSFCVLSNGSRWRVNCAGQAVLRCRIASNATTCTGYRWRVYGSETFFICSLFFLACILFDSQVAER